MGLLAFQPPVLEYRSLYSTTVTGPTSYTEHIDLMLQDTYQPGTWHMPRSLDYGPFRFRRLTNTSLGA